MGTRLSVAVRATLGALALAFLVSHVAYLAPSLEDLDSINFALGVEQYDVKRHQPHPPGYPVFMALAKLSTPFVGALSGAESGPTARAARGLAIWGAVFGALAVFPLFALYRAVDRAHAPWVAVASTALALASPIAWFNAARPLSDIPGLAVAVLVQALFVSAFTRQHEAASRADGQAIARDDLVASGTAIVAGAFLAGLGIGLRSQILWLSLPLLILVLIDRAGRGAAGALLGALMTFTLGTLVWSIPMLIAVGGPMEYLSAVTSQGRDDLAEVQMLITHPTPGLIARGLLRTFVDLWAWLPLGLGATALAVIGGVVALARDRRALAVMACAFGPYALFHLAVQDTEHTRYAIPLIVPVVWLVVRAMRVFGDRAAIAGTAVAVAVSLWVVTPTLRAYASTTSPAVAMEAALAQAVGRGEGTGRVLMMHPAFAVAWRSAGLEIERTPIVRTNPWSMVVDYWRSGRTAPVWFIAEPGPASLDRHHALALVDPASRRLRASTRWTFDPDPLLGGARPTTADWYELEQPGWFVGEGWALTPSLAGMAERDGRGPSHGGVTAWVRRRDEAATMLVGGRHFGSPGDPPMRYAIRRGTETVAEWTAPPAAYFLERVDLPAGSLSSADDYVQLTVTAEAADGSRRPIATAIEQFDLQPRDRTMWAFGAGWHEAEYSLARNLLWHWSSESSTLRVVSDQLRPLTLVVTGESPLRYFDRAPVVRVFAGSRLLHTFSPAADFSERIDIPGDVEWIGTELHLRIETDLVFVPDDREGNGDRRHLGLRLYDVTLEVGSTGLR